MTKKELIKKYDINYNWMIIHHTENWPMFSCKKNKEECEKSIMEFYFYDNDIYLEDWKLINKYINWKKWVKDLIKKNKYKIINLNDYKDNDEIEGTDDD